MTPAPRRYQSAALVVAVLSLLLALLAARMLLGARRQLALAEAAATRHDQTAVDRHLRRALAYYLPLNPWLETAAQRLRQRAKDAQHQGAAALALARWRSLRSALLALRSLGQPRAALLREANVEIASLAAAAPKAARVLRSPKGQRALARRLARPPAPNRPLTVLALLGFLVWTCSALALFARGLTLELRFLPRRAAPLGLAVLLGFVAFVLGLAFA